MCSSNQTRGRPITLVGLNIALQQGDADFARKVAKVQPRVYREFKEAYMENRWVGWPASRPAGSLVEEDQEEENGRRSLLLLLFLSASALFWSRSTNFPARRGPMANAGTLNGGSLVVTGIVAPLTLVFGLFQVDGIALCLCLFFWF